MKNKLIARIQSGNATIGVVGLGYVGLPLALRFSETGFNVIGFDVDAAKAETIANRKSYFSHIAPARVGQAVDNGFAAACFSPLPSMPCKELQFHAFGTDLGGIGNRSDYGRAR